MPTRETAGHLLECYISTVQDSFPILPRKLLEDKFDEYFDAPQSSSSARPDPRWKIVINLVFAIGARYSRLVRTSSRGDTEDYAIYRTRARKLGLVEISPLAYPDVLQIQMTGLLAFYYVSIGQMSRAWIVVGTALRFAYSLGLHVRNDDPSTTAAKREILVRVWWSLYCLERLLSIITGRPSTMVDSQCSVPLPLTLSEELITKGGVENRYRRGDAPSDLALSATSLAFPTSSTLTSFPLVFLGSEQREKESIPGSFFKAVVQIGIITQDMLSMLYAPGTMIQSLDEIQEHIRRFNQRLDGWMASLPPMLNFQTEYPGKIDMSRTFLREHLLLGLHFHSARILATRPCFGSLDTEGREGSNEDNLLLFNRRMTTLCIGSAKAVVDLLPDQPDVVFLYENGPWWSIVHYLMQSFSVFLLEFSSSLPPSRNDSSSVRYIGKLLRWLREMKDPLAQRAYCVALRVWKMAANPNLLVVSDLQTRYDTMF
ncbi:hypothetical protein BS50DRAFT_595121 [Corynespora cassiicola Philippines]|uniref:Xylanolytic transcriptional activator regulatory domain-containing protein n=1 Tax=Corynespora cassiicola Philippines TaxID=1448308 RepID=A0A2T2N0A6_CORCC|nr:hypothetical protein BS50DRAFT_595121 [Corynespora cassiicola Philippines]